MAGYYSLMFLLYQGRQLLCFPAHKKEHILSIQCRLLFRIEAGTILIVTSLENVSVPLKMVSADFF